MEITTKFSSGDDAYGFKNDQIEHYVVSDISANIVSGVQTVMNKVTDENSEVSYVSDDDLFDTVENCAAAAVTKYDTDHA